MKYRYEVVPEDTPFSIELREALFTRMQEEGLLPYTMHAFHAPTKDDWLELTQPHKGWLLCCVAEGEQCITVNNIRGMAWLTPWQGRVWSFDFTAFRAHFAEAVGMSRGALKWMFTHAPCDSVLGISAMSNRHAWRLAQKAGFDVLGTIEGACYMAKKYSYEPGVMVVASRSRGSASSLPL